MAGSVFALIALVGAAAVLLRPRLRASEDWRATVTPLASIIGSGFLVSLPLLAHEVGVFAPLAMLALLVFAHFLGGAIRFNIAHAETLFDGDGHAWLTRADELSGFALAFAYFISVTYYLSLLAAFALKGVAVGAEPTLARLLTSVILIAIGGWGFFRGLRGLEAVEEYAVGLKLAVIAAILAALGVLNVALVAHGAWRVDAPAPELGWHHLRFVLGLLIVIQGFETSRYLKGEYARRARIRTMGWAQWIAAGVYAAFFALALPILDDAPATPDVAGVVDMIAPAAAVLPMLVIAGAVFAQLSAAVADAIGAAGLIHETSGRRIGRRAAYPLIALTGCVIVWSFDVLRVIQLASAAFAFYYAMQAGVAAFVAVNAPEVRHRAARAAGFAVLGLLALAAALFGLPAEPHG